LNVLPIRLRNIPWYLGLLETGVTLVNRVQSHWTCWHWTCHTHITKLIYSSTGHSWNLLHAQIFAFGTAITMYSLTTKSFLTIIWTNLWAILRFICLFFVAGMALRTFCYSRQALEVGRRIFRLVFLSLPAWGRSAWCAVCLAPFLWRLRVRGGVALAT
jgi:hypothetical protein